MTDIESKTISVLRWFMLIGVVFIHSHISHIPLNVIPSEEFPVYALIFQLVSSNYLASISLNVLFFISGYLFFSNLRGGISWYSLKIKSRCKSLVVPYLIWNIWWILITAFIGSRGHDLMPVKQWGLIDYLNAFWMLSENGMPLAGYTWFLRDLFIFAILSPIYYYIITLLTKFKKCSLLVPVILLFINYSSVFFNAYLFIGSYIALNNYTLDNLVRKKDVWKISILVFILSGIFYQFKVFGVFMIISGFMFFYSFSRMILVKYESRQKIIMNVVAGSTFMYVTHTTIMLIFRNLLPSIFNPQTDFMMIFCYFSHLILTIFTCYIIYRKLKLYAPQVLTIITGGRI
ncbi:hypothetical protein FACS1894181_01430 [Bacteroidia bacterium]|nr:hypothetical protein FACS1894181_01430 [Bacteroidia bacterium]